MNPESTKQIIDAITPLADKLGQGAAHLYAIYVRQMVAEGVAGLAFSLILVALLGAAWFTYWRMIKSKALLDPDYPDYWGYILVGIFAGLASLVVIGVILGMSYDAILKLANPEYAAIDRIITTVRGSNH